MVMEGNDYFVIKFIVLGCPVVVKEKAFYWLWWYIVKRYFYL